MDDVIVIAGRESAKKNITGALSSFGLFTTFLLFDIIFYIRDKYTWELVILIISAILAGFSFLGLLFAWSNYGYAKKILAEPLITFNVNQKTFGVVDCIFHRNTQMNRDDVVEIKISDSGEAYLWYNKNSKKTSMFIGYSDKSSEELINNEVAKYKNID